MLTPDLLYVLNRPQPLLEKSEELVHSPADMDDTLVMTSDADLKAYTDVVKLAKQLHKQVRSLCLFR